MATYMLLLPLCMVMLCGCEKEDPFAKTTQYAKIVGFVTEKCGCCWGWVIEIDKTTIKSNYIPGLDMPSDLEAINNLKTTPITGKIKIGNKEMDCDCKPDYYEILKFDIY